MNVLDDDFNFGGTDAFVAKLNASGNALVYSTYLGGNDDDVGRGIAVDAIFGGAYSRSHLHVSSHEGRSA